MDIAKIGWGLGTLAAVVLTFVNTGHDGTILAVLGLIAGYASAADHRRGGRRHRHASGRPFV